MNTRLNTNSSRNYIAEDYKSLMVGFVQSPLFFSQPILSNGKYVQLSAYDEKEMGQAFSANSNSNLIAK